MRARGIEDTGVARRSCSPGRWPPGKEELLRNKLLEKAAMRAGGLLEREVFSMAAGGEAGCKLVTDQQLIQELFDIISSWTWSRYLGLHMCLSRRRSGR